MDISRRSFLGFVSASAAALGLSRFLPQIEAAETEVVAVCDPECSQVMVAVQGALVGPEPRTILQLEPFLEDSFSLYDLILAGDDAGNEAIEFSLDRQRRRASTFPLVLHGFSGKAPSGLRAWQAGTAREQRIGALVLTALHRKALWRLQCAEMGEIWMRPPSFVGLVAECSVPAKANAVVCLRRLKAK